THGADGPAASADEPEDDFGFTPLAFALPQALPELTPSAAAAGWRVVFRPHGGMYANANEASLLLRELGRLGSTVIELDDSAVPMLDALEVEDGCLSWTIDLDADVEEAAVREVFDFVESDCDL